MSLENYVKRSRTFKRLNEYPPFLPTVHQKTKTSFCKQSQAFDFHMVSLKSRNLDEVAPRPSQYLTTAAVALPGVLTPPGWHVASPAQSEGGACRASYREPAHSPPQAPSQSQAHRLPLPMRDETQKCVTSRAGPRGNLHSISSWTEKSLNETKPFKL